MDILERTAEFEKMARESSRPIGVFESTLEKAGMFGGLRGWLYLDGGFDELKSRGKTYHQEFAIDHLMEDAGIPEWIKNNPLPDIDIMFSARDLRYQIGTVWRHRNKEPGWADWIHRMMRDLNLDDTFMSVLANDIDVNDYYAEKYNAIRIWGEGDIILINAPHFTQKHLDVLWKFILSNIESQGWKRFEIESDDGIARGEIWDLPTKADKLFKKEWWRVASPKIRVQYNRLIAEDNNWNQEKLNWVWKFAIKNIENIKTFSLLNSSSKIIKGDIWELPKKIEDLQSLTSG